MAEKESRFNLIIGAVDRISAPFQKFNDAVNKPIARLKTLNSRLKNLGREIGLGKVTDKLQALGKEAGNVKDKLGSLLGTLGKLAAGGAALGAGLFGVTVSLANAGDEAVKSAQKAGVSIQSWQEMAYAAKMSGVESQALAGGLAKLSNNAVKAALGGKEQAQWFARAGVSLKDMNGKVKPANVLLTELSRKFSGMEDGPRKTALAFALFGRSGMELIPLLNSGPEGLAKLTREARRLGIVLDDKVALAGEAFNDNVEDMMFAVKGLGFSLGQELMPYFNEAVTWIKELIIANRELIAAKLAEWLEKIKNYFADIENPVQTIIDKIESFTASVTEAVDFVGGWGNTLKIIAAILAGPLLLALLGLTKAVVGFGLALLTTPIGWIMAGIMLIAGGIYLIIKNWDKIKAWWRGLWDKVKELFNNFIDWIGSIPSRFLNFGKQIVDNILQGLKNAWEGVKNWFSEKIDGLMDMVPDFLKGGGNAELALAGGLAFSPGVYDFSQYETLAPPRPLPAGLSGKQNTHHVEEKVSRLEIDVKGDANTRLESNDDNVKVRSSSPLGVQAQ